MLCDREHEVLGRDVLVLELAHLGLGVAQDLDELARAAGGLRGRRALDLGQRVERLAVGLANRGGVHAKLTQHRHHDSAVLLEQYGEHVLGHRLRVSALVRESLSGLESLLALDRKSVWLHRRSRCRWSRFRWRNLSLSDLDYDRFCPESQGVVPPVVPPGAALFVPVVGALVLVVGPLVVGVDDVVAGFVVVVCLVEVVGA